MRFVFIKIKYFPILSISEELEEMMIIIQLAMESAFQMKVPLKVEGTYAKNWYDLKYTKAAV